MVPKVGDTQKIVDRHTKLRDLALVIHPSGWDSVRSVASSFHDLRTFLITSPFMCGWVGVRCMGIFHKPFLTPKCSYTIVQYPAVLVQLQRYVIENVGFPQMTLQSNYYSISAYKRFIYVHKADTLTSIQEHVLQSLVKITCLSALLH